MATSFEVVLAKLIITTQETPHEDWFPAILLDRAALVVREIPEDDFLVLLCNVLRTRLDPIRFEASEDPRLPPVFWAQQILVATLVDALFKDKALQAELFGTSGYSMNDYGLVISPI